MPGAPRNAWGVWGAPEPIKPWEHGAPKLHSEIGGPVKPEFAETLQWFYGRAINPKDKEHCARLLAQIRLQQEDSEKTKFAVQGRTLKTSQAREQRPFSAKPQSRQRSSLRIQENRPRSAVPTPARSPEDKIRSSYRAQKESVERLSRPKATKQVTIQEKFRPKSAMAAIGTTRRKSGFDPYSTTHEREYQGYPSGLYAEANRPMSTNGFTFPYELPEPIGNTTAEGEFGWKEATKAEPIRSGTSSGNRRNNPHPHESFMIWKLPKETTAGMITKSSPHLQYRSLTKDVLGEIISEQLKSTYQNDYIGIPQGFQIKTAIDAPPDWKTGIRRTMNTTERCSYKRPEQAKELTGNVTRYGCNNKKGVPALGGVPTVTASHVRNQEVIKGKTTYNVQFRNRYEQPDLEQLLKNQPNTKAYERFMKYARSELKDKYEGTRKAPAWVTKWEGPHHHEHQ